MQSPQWADVSRETMEQLTRYAELLVKWNQKINLVAPGTIDELWTRHIWDSYQLATAIPEAIERMADIGSGGGLPGLILAIARPELSVTLIERDQRKCAFLTQAALSLGLRQVRVINKDIAQIAETFDLVTARALAALDELFRLALPLLGKDAFCLFPKGANFATEIEEAKKGWDFTHAILPSKTHDSACIISVSKLKPRLSGM
jgi:16S rRNA (guanine527-N7)-methyltransferase